MKYAAQLTSTRSSSYCFRSASRKKGTGFERPPQPHQHWHIDVSYLNVGATFYYLCSILDGYSRFLVQWDLREQMTEADIEIILERAKERYAGVKPRVISDNGPQFIAKDRSKMRGAWWRVTQSITTTFV